ncbi:MAG TPA: glycosyltransferase family 4 protein [bacterium]|nr:glycosyltransferase family 4 protein [bacterium]
MKLLMYDTTPAMGGSVHSGAALLNGLVRGGDQVVLLASRPELFSGLLDEAIHLARVNWDNFHNLYDPTSGLKDDRIPLFSQWLAMRRLGKRLAPTLHKLLKEFAPDLLHINQLNIFAAPLIAFARRHRLPVVMHGREIRLYGRSEIRLAAQSDRYICVSRAERENMLRQSTLPADKIVVIANGIDENAFPAKKDPALRDSLHLPRDAKIACLLGRLCFWKGQHVAIEAWSIVKQTLPRAILALVGTGEADYETHCRNLTREYGLEDNVVFLGQRDNINQLLAAFDLVVHASCFADPAQGPVEAMGRVAIEAMAAALPLVATDAGGIPDIVEDGVTGRLAPPGDAQAMAEAVLAYLSDDDAAQAAGKAGYERVRANFTNTIMTNKVRALYAEVLAARA